jgi:hypothetical protein
VEVSWVNFPIVFDVETISSKWPNAMFLPLTATSLKSEFIEDLVSPPQVRHGLNYYFLIKRLSESVTSRKYLNWT